MFQFKYALLKVVGVPCLLKDPEDVRPGYCGPGGEFQGVSVQIYKVEDFLKHFNVEMRSKLQFPLIR